MMRHWALVVRLRKRPVPTESDHKMQMHMKLQSAGGATAAAGVPQQQSADGVSVTQLRQGNIVFNSQYRPAR